MTTGHVRAKVVVSVLHDHRVLLGEFHDDVKDWTFHVPIGGGVEFGESLADAAHREVREEIGLELRDLEFLGFHENLFTFNGLDEHEIIFHFAGEIGSEERRTLPVRGTESNGVSFPVAWHTAAQVESLGEALVPAGIADELIARLNHPVASAAANRERSV